jgi:ParB-like chromosome segregation protein Spo0J
MATKAKAKAKKLPAKKTRKAAAKPGKGNPDTKVVKLAFVPGKEPLIPRGIKGELRDIPLSEIKDPPGPPDRMPGPEDAKEIAETAGSIAEVGQLQPILVEETPKGYVRVFGRRRIAACKLLGWKTIQAVVCGVLSPAARRVVIAVENVQRKNLTPIEEAVGVADLLDLQALEAARQLGVRLDVTGGFGMGASAVHGKVITAEVIAELEEKAPVRKAWANDVMLDHRVRARACDIVAAQLAKPVSWVRDRMYLARLDEDARALVREGKLPLLHAREIARVGDPSLRRKLAKDYAAGGSDSISDDEAGKLESLKYEVSSTLFRLATVPWKLEVQVAGKRPCEGCPHNSTSQPGLFDGGGKASDQMFGGRGRNSRKVTATDEEKGVCTNGACYQTKLRATKSAASDAAKKVVDAKGEVPAIAKEICRPAVLTEKIADRRKLQKSRGTGLRSRPVEMSPRRKEELKLEEERREAGYKLDNAHRERVAKHEPAFAKKLNAKPGLWAAFTLLRASKPYEATQHWDKPKAAKAAKAPQLVQAAQLLAGDPLPAIVELEKLCGRHVGLFDKHRDGNSGFFDLVAGVLGVDVGTPPVLEDFMASARKAKADAERKAKAEREEREEPAQEEERESESAEPDEAGGGEDEGGEA